MSRYTQAQREKMDAGDFAGPDRSFPILDQQDVDDAATLVGHADDPEKVKAKIIAIAKRKGLDIPKAWQAEQGKSMSMDTLITSANEIKSLGGGKFAGFLVRFSDETQPDLAGDFFTSETDFGLTPGEVKSTPVYYNHALDPTLKARKIGTATMQLKDAGVWFEGEIAKSDAYNAAVEKLLGLNRLGASSGTASHLVEREAKGKAFHVTSWPLGLDASLTPEPCDPYNHVLSIKSAQDNLKSIADLLREIEKSEPNVVEIKTAGEVPDALPSVSTDEATPPADPDPTRGVIETLNAMPLKTYLLAVRGVVQELNRRTDWIEHESAAIKQGRVMSAANLQTLKDVHKGLTDHAETLGAMIERHSPDTSTSDDHKDGKSAVMSHDLGAMYMAFLASNMTA